MRAGTKKKKSTKKKNVVGSLCAWGCTPAGANGVPTITESGLRGSLLPTHADGRHHTPSHCPHVCTDVNVPMKAQPQEVQLQHDRERKAKKKAKETTAQDE